MSRVVVVWRSTIAKVCAVLSIAVASADAQSLTPGPPGPFVIDIRGVTSGIPNGESLHPDLPAATVDPTRGFGGSVGGHVYAIRIGPGRLGVGIDVLYARGSNVDATSTFIAVAPQLSFNFGTADGWSYLSAGVGSAGVRGVDSGISETVRATNWGGGARWFLGPHLGVGFDIRVHMLAAGDGLPKATTLAAAVGISVK